MASLTSTAKQRDKASLVLKGFLKYKNDRIESGWDNIATRSAKFYFGEQWSEADAQYLYFNDRAASVFNMILPAVDLIVGHQIQGRVDLVAHPVDQYADVKLASVISSAIKNIEQTNNATFERRMQFLDGLITGVGIKEHFLDTETSIEGKIRVQQDSAWHWYLDKNVEKYDYRDGHKLYKEYWLTREDIKAVHGPRIAKKVLPIEIEELSDDNLPVHIVMPSWSSDPISDYGDRWKDMDEKYGNIARYNLGYDQKKGLIRVIEQYEKVYKKVEFYYDIERGEVFRLDSVPEEDRELLKDLTIPRTISHIQLTTIVGHEVLAQDVDTKATEFNQLFDFFFPYWVNGKYMGIVENLIYPQEEINKRHSTIIQILNTFANSGIFYEDGAFEQGTTAAEIEQMLARNGVAIQVAEGGIEKIKPIYSHDVPPTLHKIKAEEKEDVKYISGAGDAIQGISRRQESGRAKETEIAQSAVRLAGIIENFHETMKMEGKSYLWWIKNYMTEEKLIRVLGENPEDMTEVTLNKQAFDQIFNDVTIGEYDIFLELAGKTTSERQRNRRELIELGNTVPLFADIIAEEVLVLSDIPQKDKLLQKWRERQQQIAQQAQADTQGQIGGGGRGPIQSATRPSRGPRRTPQAAQATG